VHNYTWYTWRSGEETGTKDSFYTDDFGGTGDGYIIDYSLGLTTEEFQDAINNLLSNTDPPYLDDSTAI